MGSVESGSARIGRTLPENRDAMEKCCGAEVGRELVANQVGSWLIGGRESVVLKFRLEVVDWEVGLEVG